MKMGMRFFKLCYKSMKVQIHPPNCHFRGPSLSVETKDGSETSVRSSEYLIREGTLPTAANTAGLAKVGLDEAPAANLVDNTFFDRFLQLSAKLLGSSMFNTWEHGLDNILYFLWTSVLFY